MKSQNSYYNKALVKNIVKTNYVAMVLYFGLLLIFAVIPFYLLIREYPESMQKMLDNYDVNLLGPKNDYIYSGIANEIFLVFRWMIPLVLITTIIISFLVFRRNYQERSANILHSMPIKRSSLYNSLVFTIMVLCLVPLLISILLLILFAVFYQPIIILLVINLGLFVVLLSLITIALMAFSGSLSGHSVMQLIIGFLIAFLPVAFILILNNAMYSYINGYVPFYPENHILLYVCPYYPFVDWLYTLSVSIGPTDTFGSIFPSPINKLSLIVSPLIYSTIVSSLLFIFGQRLFIKRKLERFLWINHVWSKYILAISLMLFCTYSFSFLDVFRLFDDSPLLNIIVSGLLGSLTGFSIGVYMSYQHLMLHRHLKLFIIGFLITIGSMLTLFGGGKLVYTHIPDISELKYITLIDNYHGPIHYDTYKDYQSYPWEITNILSPELTGQYKHTSRYSYETTDNMTTILDYLKKTDLSTDSLPLTSRGLYLVYHYKNGRIVQREYRNLALEEDTLGLHTTQEHIQKHHDVLRYNSDYITRLAFHYPDGQQKDSLVIDDKNQISKAMTLLFSENLMNNTTIKTHNHFESPRVTIFYEHENQIIPVFVFLEHDVDFYIE